MSNVNIRRAVENIRASTTIYSPLVEVIVNAIQAIESSGPSGGKVTARVQRADQIEMDGSLPEICGFEVEDNGEGFNDANRDSFDTLYTDRRIDEGGKGFGRFICLKYFETVTVESCYRQGDAFRRRSFSMGRDTQIIVNENVAKVEAASGLESNTVVRLKDLKHGKALDKQLSTIARHLVEKLLPYFITQDYACPRIVLSEMNGAGAISLNDYITNDLSAEIKELPITDGRFTLKGTQGNEAFLVRMFKLYAPRNHKSRISLVAHKREVSGSPLHNYVPEFVEDFYEMGGAAIPSSGANYIVKAYVFGQYLDRNVSLERGGFEFQMENDALYGIAQAEIERETARIAQSALGSDISIRQEKKKDRVQSYVDDEAPWHKAVLETIDLTGMPYNPSNEEIEGRLQKEKLAQEVDIKKRVSLVLADSTLESLKKDVVEIVRKISGTSKNDLIHYIALRRNLLDLLAKSLEINEVGAYESEGLVHDIIFPRKRSTDTTSFEAHNLWLIDERLNFTKYVSSDLPLNGPGSERPDLLVYNKRILFRGDNEPSNPVTIFEFKKPQLDKFANPSSPEDPVQQIVRYVNGIRDGKFKTPEGRRMLVEDNTPFYGYVVCDINPKVEEWLRREKNFKPMPDRLGYFQWLENINLYVEVLSWDKVLKDAKMRNQIFFQKLGI